MSSCEHERQQEYINKILIITVVIVIVLIVREFAAWFLKTNSSCSETNRAMLEHLINVLSRNGIH
jgi:hypothetical protein